MAITKQTKRKMCNRWRVARLFVLFGLIGEALVVPRSNFYSLRSSANTGLNMTSKEDAISVDLPISLYNVSASEIFVSKRGFITLGNSYNGHAPTMLPLNGPPVVSVYWTNSTPSDQKLLVDWTNESMMRQKFADDVATVFPDLNGTLDFSNVTIATWQSNLTFSFQCVLGTSGEDSFAVFLFESSQSSYEKSGSRAIVGFDDGHGNYWMSDYSGDIRNGIGNVPSVPGKYVMSFKNSACSATKWSSNRYCSIGSLCIMNNGGGEQECEACNVFKSRFNWTSEECEKSSGRTKWWIVGGTGGAFAIVMFMIIAFIITVMCRRRSGSYDPSETLKENENGIQKTTTSSLQSLPKDSETVNKKSQGHSPKLFVGDGVLGPLGAIERDSLRADEKGSPKITGDQSHQALLRENRKEVSTIRSTGKSKSAPFDSREDTASKGNSFLEISSPRRGVSADIAMQSLSTASTHTNKTTNDTRSAHSTKSSSDNNAVVLPLTWKVGKKAITIGVHMLNFEFPSDCLENEITIEISIKLDYGPDNSNLIYIYSVAPHDLAFTKPVTVRFNSKWKASDTCLWRRESKNAKWIPLGNFGDENKVNLDEFCDLCVSSKEKLEKLGQGFTCHNVLAIGKRDRNFVTIDIVLLADNCKDKLQLQNELWRNSVTGNRICVLQSHELLLFETGKINVTVTMFDEEENPWMIKGQNSNTIDFAKLKQKLIAYRNLLTCHLAPKGITVEEAIIQACPSFATVIFEGCQSSGKPHSDEAKFSLMFGDCLEDVAKKLPAHEENHTTSAPSHSRNMHSFNGTQNSKTQVSNPTPVALEQVKAESESGDEIARIAEIVREKIKRGDHKRYGEYSWCQLTDELVDAICETLSDPKFDQLRNYLGIKSANLLKCDTPQQAGYKLIEAWVAKKGANAKLEILLEGCWKAGILGIVGSQLEL
eukprot:m.215483 g.215483  ORF g.215483 m.215483 type:complete len:936 (+) comp39833_c3_seq32:133-2940(+)